MNGRPGGRCRTDIHTLRGRPIGVKSPCRGRKEIAPPLGTFGTFTWRRLDAGQSVKISETRAVHDAQPIGYIQASCSTTETTLYFCTSASHVIYATLGSLPHLERPMAIPTRALYRHHHLGPRRHHPESPTTRFTRSSPGYISNKKINSLYSRSHNYK